MTEQKCMLMWKYHLVTTKVMTARTGQNRYYTMIGLESPDLPHAN
jgi:hypothetical protein